MFQNYLSSINGIEIYPLISFIAFFVFFIVMAVWIISTRKDFVARMSSLPLNNDELIKPDTLTINRNN